MADPAPAPAPSPDPVAPWHQGVPPEIIGTWQNKAWKFDDPKTIAIEATKSYMGVQQHVGHPLDHIIKLPLKLDDEAGWKGVYSRLGVPNEAKDYDLSGVKFADGSDLPAALTTAIREGALAARVPKDHGATIAKAVAKAIDGERTEAQVAAQVKVDAERESLKKSWGQNFEYNKTKAMDGVRRLGFDPDTVNKIESIVGYEKIMEAFRRVGVGTSEDSWKDSGGPTNQGPMTREAAIARTIELKADKAWVARYLDGGVVEKREMTNLNRIITPENRAA
jgi:hypothetical protein